MTMADASTLCAGHASNAAGLERPIPTPRGPICVVCPELDSPSETFIRQHIQCLPQPVRVVYGRPPAHDEQGNDLVSMTTSRTLAARLQRRIRKTNYEQLRVQALAKYFKSQNIRCVLAEYGTVGTRIVESCRLADVPFVVHFHGADVYHQEWLQEYRSGYAAMFQQAAAIVAVSRDMQEELIRIGAPSHKIACIPCGVDTSVFFGGAPAKNPPNFVAVGRFVEKKGPQLTLLAFSKVIQKCPTARLAMIGDGPLWGACYHMRQALGLNDTVDLRGACNHETVRNTLRTARAFVQHSLRATNGDCEGTPVGIMEAQATGLPVVATAHTGIKDVVLDGLTGLLVNETDVEGMAAAMTELATDSAKAATLGRAGRERIEDHFSACHCLEKLASVIDKCSILRHGAVARRKQL